MHRLLASLLFIISFSLNAQSDERYQEEIFNEVSVTTVIYSDVHNLKLDVYQPLGDTLAKRPLLIIAHGGSFVSGVRTNPTMVSLGNTFAKRGYVVASISYRLIPFTDLFSSESAIIGVAKALSDGRGAVRYFRKTVALEDNPFRIDGNQIYFGGNSAGGVIAVHTAFMQEEDVTDPALLSAINSLGGIDGDSGNEGYSSELRGAISLAGAIADVNFITLAENNKVLISCHGDQDETVPYLCGQPLGSSILPELCGGGAMQTHTASIGFTNHKHLLFENADHVPWVVDSSIEQEMIDFVSMHLYNALDSENIQLDEKESNSLLVFPNPTSSKFRLSTLSKEYKVIIYNLNGVELFRRENTNEIDIEQLTKGIYTVQLIDEKQYSTYTRVVKL
tara:strand:- start:1322 stop:2497 length:1176 start_codon:yes stop_codon:yes gene_type:complete